MLRRSARKRKVQDLARPRNTTTRASIVTIGPETQTTMTLTVSAAGSPNWTGSMPHHATYSTPLGDSMENKNYSTGSTSVNMNTGSNLKCYAFNYEGSCFKQACFYKHVCIRCNAGHPIITCRNGQTFALHNQRPSYANPSFSSPLLQNRHNFSFGQPGSNPRQRPANAFMGQGAYLHKNKMLRSMFELARIDVKFASPNLIVNPADFDLLGIELNGHFNIDKSLPFGCSISCSLYEKFETFFLMIDRFRCLDPTADIYPAPIPLEFMTCYFKPLVTSLIESSIAPSTLQIYQRGHIHVANCYTSIVGDPVNVWIVGSSLVKHAIVAARDRPGLGRLNASLWWHGKGSMIGKYVKSQLRTMKKYEDPPHFLILHLAGNDIGSSRVGFLRIEIKNVL
ncbi:unnamed protein product [Mytilus coruscus]|uniref:Uncharacterized protein n=1 Tax=Mytilus coruscus TaxID=42192 RepID=A0A6J8AJR5_MYTCO|nr:unnamed protein product [Mytilus coruscus]